MAKYKCPNCGFDIDVNDEWASFSEQVNKCPGCSHELHFFTCKECGEHELQLEEISIYEMRCTDTLPCICGETDIAAIETGPYYEGHIECYELNEDHRIGGKSDFDHITQKEYLEEIIEAFKADAEGEGESEIFCEECYDDPRNNDWKSEYDEDSNEEVENEWYLYCANCGHEVEYGWSHPEGGRIWPAECIDFNPWKTCPIPRYEESWRKKGWLRPLN